MTRKKAEPINERDIFQEVEGDYGYAYGAAEVSYVDFNEVAGVDLQSTQEANDRFLRDSYEWLPVKDKKLYGKILSNYSVRSYASGKGILFRTALADDLERTIRAFQSRSGGFEEPKDISITISDEQMIFEEFYSPILEIFKQSLDNKRCSGIRDFSRILLEQVEPEDLCFPLYYLYKSDSQLNPLSFTWTIVDPALYLTEFYNDLNFRYFLKFMYTRGFLVDLHNPTMVHYKANPKEIIENSDSMNSEGYLKRTLERIWEDLGNKSKFPESFYRSMDYKKLLKNILTKYKVAGNIHSSQLGNNSKFNKYIKEAIKRIVNENSGDNAENRTVRKGDSLVY